MRFPDLFREVKALEDRLQGLVFDVEQMQIAIGKTQTELIRAFPDAKLHFTRPLEVSRETLAEQRPVPRT